MARVPAAWDAVPVQCYEWQTAGELLPPKHKETSSHRQGHRATGAAVRTSRAWAGRRYKMAVNNHSRMGSSQMLAEETATCTCAFLLRRFVTTRA